MTHDVGESLPGPALKKLTASPILLRSISIDISPVCSHSREHHKPSPRGLIRLSVYIKGDDNGVGAQYHLFRSQTVGGKRKLLGETVTSQTVRSVETSESFREFSNGLCNANVFPLRRGHALE